MSGQTDRSHTARTDEIDHDLEMAKQLQAKLNGGANSERHGVTDSTHSQSNSHKFGGAGAMFGDEEAASVRTAD